MDDDVFLWTVQTSRDRGATWHTSPVHTGSKQAAGTPDGGRLAAHVLDAEYRRYLEDQESTEPIPLLQTFVWLHGPTPSGIPDATSATGLDSQWQATADLLTEIAGDIKEFEREKRDHEAKAALAQRAITTAKTRLASVTISADRIQMPQNNIAHAAGRSREWVRRTVGGPTPPGTAG